MINRICGCVYIYIIGKVPILINLHALVTTKYSGDMHKELAKSQVSYMHWSQLNIVVFLQFVCFYVVSKKKIKIFNFFFNSN